MTHPKNDGVPMFSHIAYADENECYYVLPPMSLRDWFAGQWIMTMATDLPPKVAAELAYKYADAMLAERERG